MTVCDLDTSVPDWVIEYPETLPLFQQLGIDYCCGGKSLEYACREQGLAADAVLSKLRGLTSKLDGKTRQGTTPSDE